jgi:hypothetical protein
MKAKPKIESVLQITPMKMSDYEFGYTPMDPNCFSTSSDTIEEESDSDILPPPLIEEKIEFAERKQIEMLLQNPPPVDFI